MSRRNFWKGNAGLKLRPCDHASIVVQIAPRVAGYASTPCYNTIGREVRDPAVPKAFVLTFAASFMRGATKFRPPHSAVLFRSVLLLCLYVSLESQHQPPLAAMLAMLAQTDALPDTQAKPAVADRNRQRTAH